jgi:hypothetical protein
MDTLAVQPLQGRAAVFHVRQQSPLRYGLHQYLFPGIMRNASRSSVAGRLCVQTESHAANTYPRVLRLFKSGNCYTSMQMGKLLVFFLIQAS